MWQTKPVVPDEVFRWHKHGDHPDVEPLNPNFHPFFEKCHCCGKSMGEHGYMEQTVCPGDWVVVMPGYYVSVYNDEQFHEKFEET